MRLPLKSNAADAAWPVDPLTGAIDLLAVPNPILMPSFTIPGDEVATLMLPAVPEMAHLHEAATRIARRLTQRVPAHITFVDPVTGHFAGDDAATAQHPAANPRWLLVDTNQAARPSRIAWETA
jgi:hypothetical protein